MTLERRNDGVYVAAVAIAKNDEDNRTLSVPCHQGHGLNNEVHDLVSDVHLVRGVDFCELGHVPLNYRATMKGVLGWKIDIPLPLTVLKQWMSSEQMETLKGFTLLHSKDDYDIEFLQVLAGTPC